MGVCITKSSLAAQLCVERVSRIVEGTLDSRGSVQIGRLRGVGIVRLLLQSGCKGYEEGYVEEDISQVSYAHWGAWRTIRRHSAIDLVVGVLVVSGYM